MVYNPIYYSLMNPLDAFNPIKQVQKLLKGDPNQIAAVMIVSEMTNEEWWLGHEEELQAQAEAYDEMYQARSEELKGTVTKFFNGFPGAQELYDKMEALDRDIYGGFDTTGPTFGENAISSSLTEDLEQFSKQYPYWWEEGESCWEEDIL